MSSASRTPLAAAAKKTARPGPRLREAALEDHAQIALLESRYGLATKSYEEWRHLHLCNPLQPECPSSGLIGWVIEDDEKQIVGSVGNVPLLYEFEGRRIRAVSGRALVADPAYRSTSLLLLDHLINQPGVELFLTNAITPASMPAFDAFECRRIPVGLWDESAFWITGYQGFFESLLAMKRWRFAKPLSYPLSAAGFLKDALTRKNLPASDVEVKACPGFDDRFDGFWEGLKRNHPHLLLAVRSRSVLEWHFKYALLKNRLWIVTALDGARLAGYAIFARRDNATLGLKRVRLVDFQSLDGTTALLAPMLSWALRKCREEGIHMLDNVGRWMEKGELIDNLGPHRRKLSTWTYVYRANNPGLAKSLSNRRAWSPTLFDATASL
jgi:hypothetical protein